MSRRSASQGCRSCLGALVSRQILRNFRFVNVLAIVCTGNRSDVKRRKRDPYRAEVSFKEVQPGYDAAVGFTPRRNYRSWNPELNWQPRFSDHRWLRGISVEAEGDINLSLDNQVIDRNLQLTPMNLEFHSGDSIEFQLFRQTENLDEDFEISDGVILPVGTGYDWLRYQVVYDGAEHRLLSARAEFSFGDFWSGDRRELIRRAQARARPGRLLLADDA